MEGGERFLSSVLITSALGDKLLLVLMELWVLWIDVLEDFWNSNPEDHAKHIQTLLPLGLKTVKRAWTRLDWTHTLYTQYPGLYWSWAILFSCNCPAVLKEQDRMESKLHQGKVLTVSHPGRKTVLVRNWELRMWAFKMTGKFVLSFSLSLLSLPIPCPFTLSLLRKLSLLYKGRHALTTL